MKPSILLRTKFLVPRPRPDLLPRPRLVDWLESQSDKRLVLLSAPAGYGKTTLLVDFNHATDRPFAWYQLDAQDSDPNVFLTYLIESLRSMKQAPRHLTGAVGQAAQSLLDSSDSSTSPQRVLTVLLNELTEQIETSCWIVLEDYHYVNSLVVHQLVDFLLENAPDGLHVVVSTRTDPPFLRSVMELAVPRGIAVHFCRLSEAAAILAEADLKRERSILLVSSAADALALRQGGVRFDLLNIGNLHFAAGKVEISASVFFSPEDFEAFRWFRCHGVSVCIRGTPFETGTSYEAGGEGRE